MEELLNKFCKIVYRDDNREKVVRGFLQGFDELTISILERRDNGDGLVVIGKSVLVSLREDNGNGGR